MTTNHRLARLYLEIDGDVIKTETVAWCLTLPKIGADDHMSYEYETDNPITRYWKWENEQ